MAQRDPTAEERVRLEKLWGYTDEEVKNLTPKHWRFFDRGSKFDEYRLVAEVIKSRNCLGGARVGDRYVFHTSGFFLPQESTIRRPCLWAMVPMLPFSYMVYDRIALDVDPSSLSIDHIKCLDVGVEHGGYGEVVFKIYCEKSPPRSK